MLIALSRWQMLIRSLSRGLFVVLLGTSIAVSVVVAVEGHALAAKATGGQAVFTLQPVTYDPSDPMTKSFFIFSSRPGAMIRSQVRVTNVGTAVGVVALTPVDATTGQNGGTVFLSGNEPQYTVGTWIKLAVAQLVLNPGQSQIVAFQVAVPRDAGAGQHVGGIEAASTTVETTRSQSKATSLHLNIRNVYVIAVQVNLPGPTLEDLNITGVQAGGYHGYQTVVIGLSNTGNVMLKPYGTLQVMDEHNNVLQNIALRVDTLLPATQINYTVNVQHKALDVGNYRAIIHLTYGHGKQLQKVWPFSVTATQLAQTFGDQGGGPLQYLGNRPTPLVMALVGCGLVLVLASALFGLYMFARTTVVSVGRKRSTN